MRFFYLAYLPYFILLSTLLSQLTTAQESMVIAVIGKTKNDSFYQQSFKGCEAFANKHPTLTCIYDGPNDYQDIRSQKDIVLSAINKGVDGLLISITDSDFLANEALNIAKQRNIPVITFDSDLLPKHHEYRLAYVGTNNFDYGVALGDYAKKFKGQGTTKICIQSGHKTTPNLNERIRGVRYSLSGNNENLKVKQDNGWKEAIRCPLYTQGKRSKAILQLKYILNQPKPPLYLAVAGFAQFSADYINTTSPYKSRIASQEIIIISADTEAIQLKALKQGLSTANIGQRPFEMGRLGTQLLFDVIKNSRAPKKQFYYLDFHYCTQKNASSCTKK